MENANAHFAAPDEMFVGNTLKAFFESQDVECQDGVVVFALGTERTTLQYFGPHDFDGRTVEDIVITLGEILSNLHLLESVP